MSKFSYSTKVGDYGDPVKMEVEVRSDVGITKEDYGIVKDALEVIEGIFAKYHKDWSAETQVKLKDDHHL